MHGMVFIYTRLKQKECLHRNDTIITAANPIPVTSTRISPGPIWRYITPYVFQSIQSNNCITDANNKRLYMSEKLTLCKTYFDTYY